MPTTTKVFIDWTKIGQEKKKEMEKKILAVGMKMVRDVKENMSIAGSGRVYGTHTASASGSYPSVQTGRLRSSISINWTGSGLGRGIVDSGSFPDDGVGCEEHIAGPDEFVVVVGTNVIYAPYLEFGTSKMGARPFLRPTFERYKMEIQTIVAGI